ncbi:peptidase S28 [Schizopora paradoxa]|uniref:Peptidase S28 n=1 Tax=Schizopora paradoxa TaxID=27342 RepID=A0A0H2S0W2_9AGAM|nr:peptidase S28 [Schizopora paradoxa]
MISRIPLLSAVLALASLPVVFSQSAPSCSPPSQFFPQKIDHSAASNNQTFQQQYQVNTKFFTPGGPIFFAQGAETATMGCTEQYSIAAWAEESNGMMLTLEHRYFGLSLPFGNDSFTNENIGFLTLDNVLLDAVNFVEWIRSTVPGANDSKVIVMGGSYGGFLSSTLRINYPDTFFGSISSAGPVVSFGPPQTNPTRENFFDITSTIFTTETWEGATKIKEGFQELAGFFDSGNFSAINDSLSLCFPPNQTADHDTFFIWAASAFGLATQFSFPFNTGQFLGVETNSLFASVNMTLAAPTPLAAINATLWMAYGVAAASEGCLDWSSSANSVGLETIPFAYIQCAYFNTEQMDISNRTIFEPTRTLFDRTQACQQQFNVTPPDSDTLMKQFKFTHDDIVNSTRIVFSSGTYDPTTGVCAQPSWFPFPVTDLNRSFAQITSGLPHTLETVAESPNDPPQAIDARRIQLNTIKAWLGFST